MEAHNTLWNPDIDVSMRAGKADKQTVDATLVGSNWAVHRTVPATGSTGASGKWTVTHVPSGFALWTGVPTKRAALKLAELAKRDAPRIKDPHRVVARLTKLGWTDSIHGLLTFFRLRTSEGWDETLASFEEWSAKRKPKKKGAKGKKKGAKKGRKKAAGKRPGAKKAANVASLRDSLLEV